MAQYYLPSVRLVVWVNNVLILILLPLIRSTARWTALGADILGIITGIWDIVEIVILPPAATMGPAVGLVFASLLALFALRAYFEKPLPIAQVAQIPA